MSGVNILNLKGKIVTMQPAPVLSAEETLAKTAEHYKKVHGITVDISRLTVPPKPKYDAWPLYIPHLTCNQLMAGMRMRFGVWTNAPDDDIDGALDPAHEQRGDRTEPYLIWVCATEEADPELANKSANDLGSMPTMNMRERAAFEDIYSSILNPGEHPDEKNMTLVAGSRDVYGDVPYADWSNNMFRMIVSCFGPDYCSGRLRARAVVA